MATTRVGEQPQSPPTSTMALYLLFILGIVESQTTRSTEDSFQFSHQGVSVTTKNNGTIHNLTLSDDELSRIKVGSPVTTEDDESFQDWENEVRLGNCDEDMLIYMIRLDCGEKFSKSMSAVSKEKWCVLEEIIRPYHQMTVCLEKWSNWVGCFYPNPYVQEFFLKIHTHFFQNCSKDELFLVDAPQSLVLTLTLIPVSLIPALVYMVIWKNRAHE